MTVDAARSRSSRLDNLTGLRFYAAVVVVMLHVTRIYAPIPVVSDLFAEGSVGVSFFFVLSGFVLTWSRREAQRSTPFFRNRFARVYPLHLLTWVAIGVVILLSGQTISPLTAIATLFMLQAWVPLESVYFGMNGPSWSLSDEAFFYALFPWISRRITAASRSKVLLGCLGLYFGIAFITLVGHVLIRGGPTVAFFYVSPLYRLWEFILGIVLAVFVKAGWRLRLGLRSAGAITVLCYFGTVGLSVGITQRIGPLAQFGMKSLPSDLASLIMIPAFMLLIAAAATAELSGRTSHLRSPMFVRLGQWSFALYLSHLVLVTGLSIILPHTDSPSLNAIKATATLAAAIFISGILYQYVEHPLNQRLRARMPGSPAPDRQTLVK
ncbi:acyltransferase family protein [Arthrobacter sp. KN11-1C]|uniref:acyltransferase family protein n=1 Tax=Arthrobacter sp. KN11-1C TaxID=3445774 RepID=UPI003FA0E8F4